jgi:hypothetical protein
VHITLKRLPAAPRTAHTIPVTRQNPIETITPIPYDTTYVALRHCVGLLELTPFANAVSNCGVTSLGAEEVQRRGVEPGGSMHTYYTWLSRG